MGLPLFWKINVKLIEMNVNTINIHIALHTDTAEITFFAG